MNAKQFVEQLRQDNEALFRAGELNVKAYFDSKPSRAELTTHFIGRMVNERMNMSEISARIANMPASASPEELQLLTKQAMDEAIHFRMVKEVVEHITGEALDVEAAIASEQAKPTAKGAALLAKYEAETDELALAVYQFIAEGRAERNWDMMADCISDEFVSSRYAKIARDEGFHANIGARKLEQLCVDAGTQARATALAQQMRKDLYEISCANSKSTVESQQVVAEAYGW
jgi:rubrerythrin